MSHARKNLEEFPIRISSSDTIYIQKDEFNGDNESAINFINDFFKKNTARMENHGWGYHTLIINGKERHMISPRGIDLAGMLKICKRENPHDSQKDSQHSTLSLNSSNSSHPTEENMAQSKNGRITQASMFNNNHSTPSYFDRDEYDIDGALLCRLL